MLHKLKKFLSLLLIFSTYVSGLPLPPHELLENKCSYASKHSKGAEIGLVPDGIANKSEAESIEAGRILEEKVQESSYHSVHVINPSISELMAAATQVTELQALKAKIAETEILKGKKMLEADKMARKVEEIYLQTEEQIAREDQMEVVETLPEIVKPIESVKKEVLPQVPEQEVKLDRTILKALGFERITDKVTDQYFRDKDTEATELFILNQLQVGAADPFSSNALRRARIAMDNYAELHPEQARNFGIALDSVGKAMTAGTAVGVTIGALAAGSATLASAPVTLSLATFAAAYYMLDKTFELVGEGISAGIEKASEFIASKFTSDTETKAKLSADVEFLGDTVLFAFMAKGGVKSIKPKAQGFRVLRKVSKENIPAHATPKTFHREVEWTAPTGTQQTYRVVQRNDIDWMKVREKGAKDFIGKTNLEAALEGIAPELADGKVVNLHHVGQKGIGPLIELAPNEHTSVLHREFGYRRKHPEFPVSQKDFGKERPEYWKTRAMEVKGEK